MRDIGLVLISNYWCEVQWVLPVLIKMKELEPTLKLCVAFSDPNIWFRRDRNLGVAQRLDEVVDSYVIGAPVGLDPNRIRFVMRDFSRASSFREKVCADYKGAKIVVYPHSTIVYIAQPANAPDPDRWKTNTLAHDLMLVATKYDIEFWGLRIPSPNLKAIGFPRYDDWWIRTLTTSSELLNSKEYEIASKFKVVMWATRGPNLDLSRHVYFPEAVHDYLVRSTAEVVLEDPDNFLIIRPHPQQDAKSLQGLANLLRGHDRWMITNLQPMQVASIADISITMWTSCIYDSLAAGTPTIEFCQYPTMHEGYMILDDGSIGSAFTYLGVTLPVSTKEELEAAFYGSDYRELYQKEYKNFSAMLVKDASELAALEILE